MKLSKSSLRISESPLHSFFAKAKELAASGAEVISLGVGDPDSDTPAIVRQAGIKAIEEGMTRYVPVAGSKDLRQAIAEKYGARYEEVVVSHGAKTVLSVALQCLVDPGDAVLIPAPYYPPFVEIVEFLGATPVLADTLDDNFQLTAQAIRQAVEKMEKCPSVLVINTPNNPTGIAYGRSELGRIVELAQELGITIISDECYSNFSVDPGFSLRQFNPDVVVVNSVSKTYAMTGWRIGWAVCPEKLAKQMALFLNNFIGCPSSVAERAALEALWHPGIPDFFGQRKLIHAWLHEIGVSFIASEHDGFYVFADFSHFIEMGRMHGSVELAEYLLEKSGVAVTPGVAFGQKYDVCLRFSFSVEMEKLTKALARLKQALETIHKSN